MTLSIEVSLGQAAKSKNNSKENNDKLGKYEKRGDGPIFQENTLCVMLRRGEAASAKLMLLLGSVLHCAVGLANQSKPQAPPRSFSI